MSKPTNRPAAVRRGLTRRGFLKGAGVAAAASALGDATMQSLAAGKRADSDPRRRR